MDAMLNKKAIRLLTQAFKIAIGSSLAIYLATLFGLQFAASAGIITLLTILTTTLETLKLSLFRIVTFVFSVAVSWLFFTHMNSEWLAYGLFLLLMVAFCEAMGWKATISVNAVIGTHFLTNLDFGMDFIINEFFLVLIGISIAIILNLLSGKETLQVKIKHNIRYTEERMQKIMTDMASYLGQERMDHSVWDDIIELEKHIQHFIEQAYEYHGNMMKKHTDYYVSYFEMRSKQCSVLHSLHHELRRIRLMPKQAEVIARYMMYLRPYITEMNDPILQIEELEQMCRKLEQEELPQTHEEFESRALLYHVLIDLEEFLAFKKRFVEEVDEVRIKEYWEG